MDAYQRGKIIGFIQKYQEKQESYRQLAQILEKVLGRIAKDLQMIAIVQAREKSVTSFAEKIQRPGKHYTNPLEEMPDLCGARVILATLEDVKRFSTVVEEQFNQWESSEDKEEFLKESEFGYRSMHFGIYLRQDSMYVKGLNIPDELFHIKSEIQVRTILQHAWADSLHDSIYKNRVNFPRSLKREVFRLAAILEETDHEFDRLLSDIRVYESNYGSYMSKEDLQREIERWGLILDAQPKNANFSAIALKIAKFARYVGNWDIVIERLTPFVAERDPIILRELGIAMCKRYPVGREEFSQGQQYLVDASKLNPNDSDALASLGGTWKKAGDKEKALNYYKLAYEANPEDSYAVTNYLLYDIWVTKSLYRVQLALPALKHLQEHCERQIALEINIPWAYFDSGLLNLLREHIVESVNYYLLGVRHSPEAWMVATTLASLDPIIQANCPLEGADLIQLTLLLCLACYFKDENAKSRLQTGYKPKETKITSPVVILVGSTTKAMADTINIAKGTILQAFQTFKGTVISGGTLAGVSEIAGALQEKYASAIRTVGYIPNTLPPDMKLDKRYTSIQKTEGVTFSIREPLQYWLDIILSGIPSKQVAVIGVGGGEISSFEYRLAALLGAQVAILDVGGVSAIKPLKDEAWKEAILQLKKDPSEIEKFLSKIT